MAVKFNAKVTTNLAQARLAKLEKKIAKAMDQTIKDLVDLGKEKARVIVPKGSTGWLYNTIRGRVTQGSTTEGMVYLDPKILPDSQRVYPGTGRYPNNFNLARWMHETGGKFRTPNPFGQVGKQHITSGDPYFMYTTRDYLNARKRVVASGNFNKVLVNKK